MIEKFEEVPIVGILRGQSLDTILRIAAEYVDAGMTTLEVTMNTEGVTSMIENLRKEFPNLSVGAGTVCSTEDYDRAVDAGAQFIVTPIIDEAVIVKSVSQDVPIFAGAFTPSEIYKAWTLGATAVKVFPGGSLGVKYVKDVLAPLNTIKLVPTGGVNIENIKTFFDAGVYGVGMGGALFVDDMIAKKDFKGLRSHFVALREAITKS